MSGHGFHVHGPHDHAVEHAAQHGSDSFSNNIAVMTAILATVGALFGYLGGATQNDAALFKNNAAIAKTTAANSWNYYQAKSSKQNLAELGAVLASGAEASRYRSEIDRYKAEKADIEKEARRLEAQSKAAEDRSEVALHQHHRWAQAMTLIQVSIALAAITLLTRSRWLQWVSAGAAAGAIGLSLLATMHI